MTLIIVQLSLSILHCQLLSLYLSDDAIVVILQLGSIRPAAQACVAQKSCDMERDTEYCCKHVNVPIHPDGATVPHVWLSLMSG